MVEEKLYAGWGGEAGAEGEEVEIGTLRRVGREGTRVFE